MPKNPLAEIFGFPTDNFSENAVRNRREKFCPFHNSTGPKCTKNSVKDPLGVCSMFENDHPAITCPVRFRQDWKIAADAAAFFFVPGTSYTSLTEVRINDKYGKSAGNLDVVLVALDDKERVIDFGALEIQAVYISGNISGAFKHYMEDPENRYDMEWPGPNYPRPDYLSSSRKRLAPQLIYKGGILSAWQKKLAVAVQDNFFNTLPPLPEVSLEKADMAWLIYGLDYDSGNNLYSLKLKRVVYTEFKPALNKIIQAEPSPVEDFISVLQKRVDSGETLGMPPESEIEPDIEPLKFWE